MLVFVLRFTQLSSQIAPVNLLFLSKVFFSFRIQFRKNKKCSMSAAQFLTHRTKHRRISHLICLQLILTPTTHFALNAFCSQENRTELLFNHYVITLRTRVSRLYCRFCIWFSLSLSFSISYRNVWHWVCTCICLLFSFLSFFF